MTLNERASVFGHQFTLTYHSISVLCLVNGSQNARAIANDSQIGKSNRIKECNEVIYAIKYTHSHCLLRHKYDQIHRYRKRIIQLENTKLWYRKKQQINSWDRMFGRCRYRMHICLAPARGMLWLPWWWADNELVADHIHVYATTVPPFAWW